MTKRIHFAATKRMIIDYDEFFELGAGAAQKKVLGWPVAHRPPLRRI